MIATAYASGQSGRALRATDAYRKVNRRWMISHEHIAVPVVLASGKP